jgi:hypothetical protein
MKWLGCEADYSQLSDADVNMNNNISALAHDCVAWY